MAIGFGFLVWVNRNQWFSGEHANDLAPFKQENKRRIVAAAALVDSGAPLIADVPAPEFDPELNTTALATVSRDGKLPSVAVDTADRLTAAEFLQLALGPAPAAGTTGRLQAPGLRSEEAGRERGWPASGGQAQILSASATVPWLRLGVVPEGTTDLCHVSGSTES